MSVAIDVGSRIEFAGVCEGDGAGRFIGYVSCNSADRRGGGEDGEFCADRGLICKGAQLCEEPLPPGVHWSSHIMRVLKGRHDRLGECGLRSVL